MTRRFLTLSEEDVSALAHALAAELPTLHPELVHAALDRAVAQLGGDALGVDMGSVLHALVDRPDDETNVDAVERLENELRVAGEWEQLVDVFLARVAAAQDSPTRALHLAALADLLETELDDPHRALTVSIEAFREHPDAAQLEAIVGRANATERWPELVQCLAASVDAAAVHDRVAILRTLAAVHAGHVDQPEAEILCLEQLRGAAPADVAVLTRLAERYRVAGKLRDRMSVLAELAAANEDVSERAAMYREMAAESERCGDLERAAHFHEWVLSCEPDEQALCALERLYGAQGRWHAAIDVYCRHSALAAPAERCWLYSQVARIYECELHDMGTAIDFLDKANRCEPGRVEIVAALARLDIARERFDDAIDALESCAKLAVHVEAQAELLQRAGCLAADELEDSVRAEQLFARAFELAPSPSVAARLGELARARGEFPRAETLLTSALLAADSDAGRAELLMQLAQVRDALGDTDGAIDLYVRALDADEASVGADEALVDPYTRMRQLEPLCRQLQTLASRASTPAQERAWLEQLLDVATELGDDEQALRVLERIVELDPHDAQAHLELASLLMQTLAHERARDVLCDVLDRFEDNFGQADCVDAHYRLGSCELECGRVEQAHLHYSTALALDPGHRPSLVARMKLHAGGPLELVTDKLALVSSSTPAERAALLTEIGDEYANVLGDSVTARAMYRDALTYNPTDHLLLNKCLGLVVEHCDWAQGVDMLAQLVDTEREPGVRAKYRHVGARILLDKLGRQDDAIAMLRAALVDDPTQERIARDLEQILRERGDSEELVRYYYARLETLQDVDGVDAERIRAWTELGTLCMALNSVDDALCAFEVAARLDAGNVQRRARLANLYFNSGPAYYAKAIEQHQLILQGNKGRMSSYHALCGLYRLTEQGQAEQACAAAVAVLGIRGDDAEPVPTSSMVLDVAQSVDPAAWTQLANQEVDRLLANLFAIAAPAFSALRGLSPHQLGVRDKHRVTASDPRRFARLLFWVGNRLGVHMPDVYVLEAQPSACRIALCRDERGVSPVVIVGAPVLAATLDERALAFAFARQLINLRRDRIARVVFRNADDLGQVVDAAVSLAGGAGTGATAASLGSWLSPLDLDQLTTIGARLAEAQVSSPVAAAQWWAAIDRTGARAGYAVCGDLAACARALVGGGREESILDLAWSSTTAPMRALRQQIEPTVPTTVRHVVSNRAHA